VPNSTVDVPAAAATPTLSAVADAIAYAEAYDDGTNTIIPKDSRYETCEVSVSILSLLIMLTFNRRLRGGSRRLSSFVPLLITHANVAPSKVPPANDLDRTPSAVCVAPDAAHAVSFERSFIPPKSKNILQARGT
jgi:hypothetical protein